MARTVVGLFDTFAEAQHVVQDLIDNGVRPEDISVLANNAGTQYTTTKAVGDDSASSTAEGAGVGALSGGALGGVLGFLVGVGALAIPGIGPVIAAGPLAAALGAGGAGALVGAATGAATGGVLGALIGAGIPEEDAHYYAEGVRRGGTLVTVSTDDVSGSTVYNAMRRHQAIDIEERGTQWRESGWNRFDPNADPLTQEWRESSKLGTTAGTVAGAATGAAAGSVAGPLGTVAGGVIGAAAGAGLGAAGNIAGEKAEDAIEGEDDYTYARSRGARMYNRNR